MRAYLLGLCAGGLAAVTAIAGGFAAAMHLRPQNLIAPAISSVESVNEKFRFLRNRPDLDPQVIAVGSSITWRHIDGAALSAGTGASVLNGATGLLAVHQTRALTRLYMDLYPRAATFVMLTSLTDFGACTRNGTLFRPDDAAAYIRRERAELFFYLKYLTLARYYAAARSWPEATTPFTGDRWLDAYGSSPMQVADRGLRYGALPFDATCVEELKRFSSELRARGRQLAVVVMPARPEYLARYPDAAMQLDTVIDEAEPQFRTDGNLLVDFRDVAVESADFWDAFHLQWSAVRRINPALTAKLMPFLRRRSIRNVSTAHEDADCCAGQGQREGQGEGQGVGQVPGQGRAAP